MHTCYRNILGAFFGFWAVYVATAQSPSTNIERDSTIRSKIEQIEADQGGSIGLEIYRISDKRILHQHRNHELFTPASVVKILSTGAALRLLGARHMIKTPIYANGEIKDSTLMGDLVIHGHADPSIASKLISQNNNRFSQELAFALRANGINRISGSIVIDASISTGVGQNNTWESEDLIEPYGTGLYGFNYEDNTTSLLISSALSKRSTPIVEADEEANLEIVNKLKSGRQTTIRPLINATNPIITIQGSVAKGVHKRAIRMANPDPARLGAGRIEGQLKSLGIIIEKPAVISYTNELDEKRNTRLLHHYLSPSLDTLCLITNHRSVNLYAEAIAEIIDEKQSGGEALNKYWRKQLDLDHRSLRLIDGSGLSRENKLSAHALSLALIKLFGGEEPADGILLETLPQVGEEGTVKKLIPSHEITAYLKSGTMRNVCSYAGYVWYDGEWYIVTYLSNNIPSATIARKLFREIMRTAFPTNEATLQKQID